MENIPRTMITIDGYRFELNTIGKWTEKQFTDFYLDGTKAPNLHVKNAWNKIKKEYAKLIKDVES
jgi:hypothetical protein